MECKGVVSSQWGIQAERRKAEGNFADCTHHSTLSVMNWGRDMCARKEMACCNCSGCARDTVNKVSSHCTKLEPTLSNSYYHTDWEKLKAEGFLFKI